MIYTRSRHNSLNVHASSQPTKANRLHILKGDIKSLVDQRFASLVAVDTVIRDLAQKDLDLRKQTLQKWIEFAKEDCEYVSINCNRLNTTGNYIHVETKLNTDTKSDNDAQAFYDPWIGD